MGETGERKVEVIQDTAMLRIYIDDLPHVIINKEEFVGFQSYKEHGVYYIEIFKKKGKAEVLTHEIKEVWEKILNALDEAL